MSPGRRLTAMRGRASDVLRLPVRLNGIRVGRPEDVLLDRDATRAVGFEVSCGDGTVRFLPYSGARIDETALVVDSPFMLVDHDERSFYRSRTRPFSALRGAEVTRRGRTLGRLDDLELGEDGDVSALVLEDGDRIDPDETIVVDARDTGAAA